jgi:hypothetical protein
MIIPEWSIGADQRVAARRAAEFWVASDNNAVACTLCYRRCEIAEGKHGWCRTRTNVAGELQIPDYGVASVAGWARLGCGMASLCFWPGELALTVGGVYCTAGCSFCSAMEVSANPKRMPWAFGERQANPAAPGWIASRGMLHPAEAAWAACYGWIADTIGPHVPLMLVSMHPPGTACGTPLMPLGAPQADWQDRNTRPQRAYAAARAAGLPYAHYEAQIRCHACNAVILDVNRSPYAGFLLEVSVTSGPYDTVGVCDFCGATVPVVVRE